MGDLVKLSESVQGWQISKACLGDAVDEVVNPVSDLSVTVPLLCSA